MNFSVTERGTFRRCRRQLVLSSKNGEHLTPILGPLNLSLGSLMHAGFQTWLEQPDVVFTTHILNAAVKVQTQVTEQYTKAVGAAPGADELLTLHEAIDMALSMSENYQIKWGTPLPAEYRLLKPEQKIAVEVPGTEHKCRTCDGRGKSWVHDRSGEPCTDCRGTGAARHRLEGKVDALIQHIPTGRIDILEHKTYGARPKIEGLRMNDQFIAYIWLVSKLGFNAHMPPKLAYDGLWRRAKAPRGRTFDDLFMRLTLDRTQAELEEFERHMAVELTEMAAVFNDYSRLAYINRPWQGCWDCRFTDTGGKIGLCRAISRGESDLVNHIRNTQFTTRTDDIEEELDDSPTE